MTPEEAAIMAPYCKSHGQCTEPPNKYCGSSCKLLVFFRLGQTHEREACAKVAEQSDRMPCAEYEHCGNIDDACDGIAKEIRARGEG